MQSVEIQDVGMTIQEFYCPFCGAKSLSKQEDMQPCPHLLYASVSEVLDEPIHGVGPDLSADVLHKNRGQV